VGAPSTSKGTVLIQDRLTKIMFWGGVQGKEGNSIVKERDETLRKPRKDRPSQKGTLGGLAGGQVQSRSLGVYH